jgi:spore germination protein KC
MKKRRWLFAVLAGVILMPLVGCWDRRELSELGIALAMGIDKVGDKFQVSVQVVQPGEVASKQRSGQRTPVTIYKAKGDTVYEAIRKMTIASPRKIYVAHLRMLVFGEQLAREGIGKAMDFLSRNYELRTDFYIVVAKGTSAANVLSILTPTETIPATELYKSVEASTMTWAPSTAVTLDELITDYVSEGKNPVLSGVEVIGNVKAGKYMGNVKSTEPAARLQNAGLAVLRKDKLLGWLSEEQSKGYNYILEQVKSTVGHVACPGEKGNIALEVSSLKVKVKGYVHNGDPGVHIDMDVKENVGEVECTIDLTQMKTLRTLEQEAQQKIREITTRTIRTVQNDYETDIFGFGNAIHRSNPRAWKSLKQNWNRRFTEMDVQVKVKVKIKGVGTISQSFLKK